MRAKVHFLLILWGLVCSSVKIENEPFHNAPFLAIDLGESNLKCIIGQRTEQGQIDLSHLQLEGKDLIPTVISFQNGSQHFGSMARDLSLECPRESFSGLVGLLGKKYEFVKEYQSKNFIAGKRVTKIGTKGNIGFKISDGTKFSVEELLGFIISNLKKEAEKLINTQISQAIFSIPSHFGESEIQALRDVGKISGFNFLHLVHEGEAIAAAIVKRYPDKTLGKTIAFFDFGAGSSKAFQVAVGKSTQNGLDIEIQKKSVRRDGGGNSLDFCLGEYLRGRYLEKVAEENVTEAMDAKILHLAQTAKETLSSTDQMKIKSPHFSDTPLEEMSITKEKFESECRHIIHTALSPLRDVIDDKIEVIFLLGQGSLNPKVRMQAKTLSKKDIPIEVIPYSHLLVKGLPFIDSEGLTEFQIFGKERAEKYFLIKILSEMLKQEIESEQAKQISSWFDANKANCSTSDLRSKVMELEEILKDSK